MDLKKAQEYIKALKNGEKFPKKNMFLADSDAVL